MFNYSIANLIKMIKTDNAIELLYMNLPKKKKKY